ncbi:MAG: hypothetical protein C4341_07780 [Armatimonadota bacterium]
MFAAKPSASRYPQPARNGTKFAAIEGEMRTYRVVLAFMLVMLICAGTLVWTWRNTDSLTEEQDINVDRAAALEEAFDWAAARDR